MMAKISDAVQGVSVKYFNCRDTLLSILMVSMVGWFGVILILVGSEWINRDDSPQTWPSVGEPREVVIPHSINESQAEAQNLRAMLANLRRQREARLDRYKASYS